MKTEEEEEEEESYFYNTKYVYYVINKWLEDIQSNKYDIFVFSECSTIHSIISSIVVFFNIIDMCMYICMYINIRLSNSIVYLLKWLSF